MRWLAAGNVVDPRAGHHLGRAGSAAAIATNADLVDDDVELALQHEITATEGSRH